MMLFSDSFNDVEKSFETPRDQIDLKTKFKLQNIFFRTFLIYCF